MNARETRGVQVTAVDSYTEYQKNVTISPRFVVQALCIAVGGKAIKCPSPLNVLKYTYDHSCY
jgi:hypothetical protein